MKRHVAGLKADWPLYLRTLRRHEIETIFRACPQDSFSCGLELGAGDGFQSTLLAPYVCRLIATDYRPVIMTALADGERASDGAADREATAGSRRVSFMTCDAERVGEVFAPQTFDLVFSSNMLEHLPDPARALRGVHAVMTGDGLAIHVIPSPFWKSAHLAGFYVNGVVGRIDRRARGSSRAPSSSAGAGAPAGNAEWDNNPKVATRERSYLARLLWPAPHGASSSNLGEFARFSRRYWRAQFEAAGFCVAAMHRGPVSSGYGFGLDALRTALERLGFSSETIYITYKAEGQGEPGSQTAPDRLRYFAGQST